MNEEGVEVNADADAAARAKIAALKSFILTDFFVVCVLGNNEYAFASFLLVYSLTSLLAWGLGITGGDHPPSRLHSLASFSLFCNNYVCPFSLLSR